MKAEKRELTSSRLRHFQEKLLVLMKSEAYLEKELAKVRNKEAFLRNKMGKEKKAIALVNKAKRLR